MEKSKKKKISAILNLVISISILLILTIYTKTTFILPPFLATAATKYPDPDWRLHRSIVIIMAYLLSGAIAVIFVLVGLYGIIFAIIASFISYMLQILSNIEHPPSILATFLGVLERVNPLFILHPVLSGIIIVEGVNYLLSKIF